MNIRSESDCDRDHKPSLTHSYCLKGHHLSYEGHKNIILPKPSSTSLLWHPSPIYMSQRAFE